MTVPKAEPEAHDRRSLHERIAADLRDDIMTCPPPPDSEPVSTPPTPRSRKLSNSSRTSAWWSDAQARR
jgi:GntR family transcriptional regulator